MNSLSKIDHRLTLVSDLQVIPHSAFDGSLMAQWSRGWQTSYQKKRNTNPFTRYE